jgi:hypothetical protein
MRMDCSGLDVGIERLLASTADEEPMSQTRSTTPAIAWPKPMHIHATP